MPLPDDKVLGNVIPGHVTEKIPIVTKPESSTQTIPPSHPQAKTSDVASNEGKGNPVQVPAPKQNLPPPTHSVPPSRVTTSADTKTRETPITGSGTPLEKVPPVPPTFASERTPHQTGNTANPMNPPSLHNNPPEKPLPRVEPAKTLETSDKSHLEDSTVHRTRDIKGVPIGKLDAAKRDLLAEINKILKDYGNLESNIPLNHTYWTLLNEYRTT